MTSSVCDEVSYTILFYIIYLMVCKYYSTNHTYFNSCKNACEYLVKDYNVVFYLYRVYVFVVCVSGFWLGSKSYATRV